MPLVRRPWLEELWGWNMPPGVILWRSEVVREIGGWKEGLRRAEDTEMNLRAWRHPAALVPKTVLRYRFHRGQMPPAEAWPIDFAAREAFVDSLPEAEQGAARRALRSRELHQEALEAYLDRDYRRALATFRVGDQGDARAGPLAAHRRRTSCRSSAKSAAGAALPGPLARRLSAARRERRGPVPDAHRGAPRPTDP